MGGNLPCVVHRIDDLETADLRMPVTVMVIHRIDDLEIS